MGAVTSTTEQETILPKPTDWVGGLHAILQHGIKQSLINSRVSARGFQLFAMAFQTIYDAAAKKSHNPAVRHPVCQGQRDGHSQVSRTGRPPKFKAVMRVDDPHRAIRRLQTGENYRDRQQNWHGKKKIGPVVKC